MKVWRLQEAKINLTKLVNDSQKGPQIISRNGKHSCVVITLEQYEELTEKKESLLSFLNSSPLCDIEIHLDQNKPLEQKS